jgi:pyruvate formate-lyase activating enzyme-like uncharacterized protein
MCLTYRIQHLRNAQYDEVRLQSSEYSKHPQSQPSRSRLGRCRAPTEYSLGGEIKAAVEVPVIEGKEKHSIKLIARLAELQKEHTAVSFALFVRELN